MSWWKSLFPKRASDEQMNSELRFHTDELTEEYIAAGMSPEEAHRRATLDFGGHENFKEQVRDVYRIRLLDATLANLKSAFRFIRKSPTFSLTVILTLALAIGANSAVFSAIDAILLKPLPFPQADQLVRVDQYDPKNPRPFNLVAPARLEDWNRLNSTFQALTGYYTEDVSESTGPLPEKVTRAWVSPRFFQVWGVVPAPGREFTPEEEALNGSNAVLISDRFWRRRFNADPHVIGKNLRLDGHVYPIVGVMPPSFLFPNREADLWCPIPAGISYGEPRENNWFTVIGRLKPGVMVEQARANLATVQAQLGQQFPKSDARLSVGIQPLKESTVGDSRRSLWLLFGSVSLIFFGGLFPASPGPRSSLAGSLAKPSRSQLSGRNPVQWLPVGVQVPLAVTLLAGAGLLLRSFQELGRVSRGFDSSHILTFQLSMNYGETGDLKKLRQFTDRILETLRATPGVESAAISVGVPGVPFRYQTEVKLLEGRAETEPKIVAENRFVSASYFQTMRIPLLAGEVCRETGGPASVVVNRAFADVYFNAASVIGHHVQPVGLGYSGAAEIRGISGDARESGLDHPPVPTAYWCAPLAEPGTYFLVRTRNTPMTMAGLC